MSEVFTDYKEAHAYAEKQANKHGREMGIEKRKEYGKEVYSVKHVPDAAHRFGHESRMEIVAPTHSKEWPKTDIFGEMHDR